MKKVFAILFALTISLGMISCSSDDDSGSGPNYSVVGKWEITERVFDGNPVEIPCELNGTRQFQPNGTYLQDEFVSNPDTGECEETEDSPLIGSYNKSGNNFTTTINNQTVNYTIEFVNENRFILTYENQIDHSDTEYTYTKQ